MGIITLWTCLPFGIGGVDIAACSFAVFANCESDACLNFKTLNRCCRGLGEGGLSVFSPKEASMAAPLGSMELRNGEEDRTRFRGSIAASWLLQPSPAILAGSRVL